jgi:metal-responsive CopG/Arc/MetJ family transcriptional regulator
MKTTISIPDSIFDSADALAKKLGLSRSELYANAVAEFVAKHRGANPTGRLNAVYAREPSRVDAGVKRAQAKVARTSRW